MSLTLSRERRSRRRRRFAGGSERRMIAKSRKDSRRRNVVNLDIVSKSNVAPRNLRRRKRSNVVLKSSVEQSKLSESASGSSENSKRTGFYTPRKLRLHVLSALFCFDNPSLLAVGTLSAPTVSYVGGTPENRIVPLAVMSYPLKMYVFMFATLFKSAHEIKICFAGRRSCHGEARGSFSFQISFP